MNELEQLTTQIRDTFEGLVNSVVQLQEYKTTARIHHSTLELIVGHIAEQEVDVIVNATNTALSGGSSDVDSAIHQAAGPQLAAASRTLAPCRAGDAVLTPGFRLPTPWVIHAVGPIYAGGQQDEAAVLDKAYRNSMRLAVQSGLTQIALPSISTGTYGYPIDQAAQIALGAVLEFIDGYRNSELLIRFVLDTRADFVAYDKILKEFAEPSTTTGTDRDDVSRGDVPQSENAEVSSSDATADSDAPADVEAEPDVHAALDSEDDEDEGETFAADTEAETEAETEAHSSWGNEEDDSDDEINEDESTVADAETETDAHASWGNERQRFLSIDSTDIESEPDISLAITETDIAEAEPESIKIGAEDIEAQNAADISIDSESISDTLLLSEIEPVMPINLAHRERYVAQDDIQLVSAREELESALNQLRFAQDEFRSDREIESALKTLTFTENEPAREQPTSERPASEQSVSIQPTSEQPASDEPIEEDASVTRLAEPLNQTTPDETATVPEEESPEESSA